MRILGIFCMRATEEESLNDNLENFLLIFHSTVKI